MKAFKELMSWIVPIAIGLLLALLIKQFAFQFVRVDGPSMQPNLQNNERVVCLKQAKIHRDRAFQRYRNLDFAQYFPGKQLGAA